MGKQQSMSRAARALPAHCVSASHIATIIFDWEHVGNAPHENLRSTDVNLPKPQERQHVSRATRGPRARRALASCAATIQAMLRIN